jgi:hypothetical protein
MKQLIVFLVILGLSSEAESAPYEAIEAFIMKLFKGGGEDVANVADHSVAKGSISNGLNYVPAKPQAVIEPPPNLLAEPISKNSKDAEAYKTLRGKAEKGDDKAMLKMADMTIKNKVSDSGEPYYGYWLLQAVRAGNQNAVGLFNTECSRHTDKRKTDRWFDAGCGKNDGKTLYAGTELSGVMSRYQPKHNNSL